MSTYSLCFSPTGGTKRVLDVLLKQLPAETQIDLSDPEDSFDSYHFSHDDVCLIGIPSFGGRVPAVTLKRLRQMKVNGARTILVVVYGNRAYEDTLLELKEETEAIGFRVIAAITAIAEHSIMHQYGAGRPDKDDIQELTSYAAEISQLLANDANAKSITVPGDHPYKEYGGSPLKPHADNSCTECGICATLCPVQAIPEDEPSTLNEDICISCMRCIDVCPEDSRGLNEAIVSALSEKVKEACASRKENELFVS